MRSAPFVLGFDGWSPFRPRVSAPWYVFAASLAGLAAGFSGFLSVVFRRGPGDRVRLASCTLRDASASALTAYARPLPLFAPLSPFISVPFSPSVDPYVRCVWAASFGDVPLRANLCGGVRSAGLEKGRCTTHRRHNNNNNNNMCVDLQPYMYTPRCVYIYRCMYRYIYIYTIYI